MSLLNGKHDKPLFGRKADFYSLRYQVMAVADKELVRANDRGRAEFSNQHEGYAMILAEIEEAEAELQNAKLHLGKVRACVREEIPVADDELRNLYDAAISMAAEAIQAAAMCTKFRKSLPH